MNSSELNWTHLLCTEVNTSRKPRKALHFFEKTAKQLASKAAIVMIFPFKQYIGICSCVVRETWPSV
jgi:hypothetical protein